MIAPSSAYHHHHHPCSPGTLLDSLPSSVINGALLQHSKDRELLDGQHPLPSTKSPPTTATGTSSSDCNSPCEDRSQDDSKVVATVDLKYTITAESLWIDGWYNPFQARVGLKRRGLEPLEISTRDAEGGGEKKGESEDLFFAANNLRSKVTYKEDHEDKDDVLILNDNSQNSTQKDINQLHKFVALLKACAKQKDLQKGSRVHAYIANTGLLEKHVFLGSALVSMYAKCGVLTKAQEVFDKLSIRNVVSWTALIAGYTQHGCHEQALKCFEQMRLQGPSPDVVTFVCTLKACASLGAADKGKEIHDEIIKRKLLKKSVVLGTALVDMYAKCGLLAKAREVFNQVKVQNVILWNVLMAGYAHHGHGEEALKCFERMQLEGLSPHSVTFVSALKACGSIGALDKGKDIHVQIVREGLLEKEIIVGTALVDMYAKCGQLPKAQEVFDQLPHQDVVSWSALIQGYTEHGYSEQALRCYEQMQVNGFSPDVVTFTCILRACGNAGATEKGKEIHSQIMKRGLMEKSAVVGNAVVDMYAKCGLLVKAQEAFDKLPYRDVVSWGALISGYTQHGYCEAALKCFEQMQLEGLSPSAVAFVCALKACGSIGATAKGISIHAEIVREGLLEKNVVVGTALVDMYVKCGLLAKAEEVFDKLPVRDVVAWSTLMAGYSLLGRAGHVFHAYDKMIGEGLKPDLITFTILLNACRHAGLLDKGQMYFETMSADYGILPTLEHYACMVDLFARAGYLDKAVAMIKEMPLSADLQMWLTVLSACQKWRNLKIGRLAFEHALQLDEKAPGAYVCMRNIYADAGRQEDADKIEAMRVERQAWKDLGKSWWTDANGTVHSFSVGDIKHPQSRNICEKLELLAHKMSQEGYSLVLPLVSQTIPDDRLKDVDCGHHEMLAIAYALIETPEGTPIHVVKDMRICSDCHGSASLISKLENRRILVRDANRFHVFEDGKCDCGEYW